MDKEDCIQVLLSTLQQPLWKSCDSVTDWDLKNVLWRAGLLLTPEQVAALFADMKRRGLISARERRSDDRIVALWGVKITAAGENWMVHVGSAATQGIHVPPDGEDPMAPDAEDGHPVEPAGAPAYEEPPILPGGDQGAVFDFNTPIHPRT